MHWKQRVTPVVPFFALFFFFFAFSRLIGPFIKSRNMSYQILDTNSFPANNNFQWKFLHENLLESFVKVLYGMLINYTVPGKWYSFQMMSSNH